MFNVPTAVYKREKIISSACPRRPAESRVDTAAIASASTPSVDDGDDDVVEEEEEEEEEEESFGTAQTKQTSAIASVGTTR